MHRARQLVCLAPLGLALLVPTVADAAPARLKVQSVASPPAAAAPGQSFAIKTSVTNRSKRAAKVRVKVTLRSSKHSKKIALTVKGKAKTVKAHKTSRSSLTVKLPASLKAGTYYVRACADSSGTSSTCRFTTRRLAVKKAAATVRPAPAPAPVAQAAPAPAAQTPLPQPAPGDVDYSVLAFTKGAAGSTASAVAALKALGEANGFGVTVSEDAGSFTAANLGNYKVVVFVNNKGDILSNAQQGEFETYYKGGGGFVAIGSAIEAEPDWAFYGDLIGTRAATANPIAANAQATIKVADRVHDASKSLPEYWKHTDTYYNFSGNVRGLSHVLATVDETTYTGGTMKTLADHPISWCKDYEGGRSFYTGTGANGDFSDANLGKHLSGAIQWAAGLSDPTYSDCGATVVKNFKQVKISAPPNLNEPIGFDQLPDGRIIQTARNGEIRLHDGKGTTLLLGKLPVYTNSEDGLYGPAIDNHFAENKWVYLYYAPPKVTIRKCDGTTAEVETPTGSAPTLGIDPCVWQDTWQGYFQLSRFKFVDAKGDKQPYIDFDSEQKIMQVTNNRGACCHVAGDIDFDSKNNLWFVTGDDTPAGSGNSGGFSPHNDQKTDEYQAIRTTNATGGSFKLTYNDGSGRAPQTTGDIPWNATAAQIEEALLDLVNVAPGDLTVTGSGTVATASQVVAFTGPNAGKDVPTLGITPNLTGTGPTATVTVTQEAGQFNAPFVDARRTALNTNDLRGKLLRIKVKDGDITPAEANKRGATGAYTAVPGNLFAEGDALARPEIYAMGFRNPYRVQVDSNDVAYITDYSPDSNVPENFRGPAGTGRVEVVRKPSNYGWPLCVSPKLPYYQWNFNSSRPLDAANPKTYECDNPNRGPANTSRWNTGRINTPPVTQPDIWYSYRDNSGPLGTPCLAYYDGSGGKCPQLFPELFQGGVAPHGAAPYEYDPGSTSDTKFPPYYNGSFFMGEFGQDQLREVRIDSEKKIFKINNTLPCGQALVSTGLPFECDNPEDMQYGADGNLYLLTYGDGFFAANADAGMYKWQYTKGSTAPTAVVSATPTSGKAPLTVQFSSAGSKDDDEGDSIRYAWDFDGDGTVDSVDANPSFIYTTNGVYNAKLTVTDSTGKTNTQSTTITVGNTAPEIKLTVPTAGDFFEFGQKVPYTVTVTDPEDGTVDCSQVKVSFVLVHDTHGHGEQEKLGCTGVLETDAQDRFHGGYLAGGIVATYTDKGGLTGRAESLVQRPRHELEYSLDTKGVTAVAATAEDGGAGVTTSSIDPGDYVSINNTINLQNMDKKITFRYAGGSGTNAAGRPRMNVEIHDGSPTGTVIKTVTLNSTGANNNTYTDQTFDLDFTGSKRLYLVFKAVDGETGAPTSGMGLINWVQFSGKGIGQ
ncbi:glucose/sorbosone dehydrogenase [Solirubrobacter pauli]|uniref:Glucose/sorbosone dehydrogenase n=1 Tax=Solirubrobacter pauli TaxID=166793 RepID=A0A660L576_9ACTN|nr:ThuA domain-containing protein [Solirubrobacter pauli]RKQ87992.1 glucose/sorbosone dehydrogenase [Solirubrobacter pauli]